MTRNKTLCRMVLTIQALLLTFLNFDINTQKVDVNAANIDVSEATSDYVDNLRYGFNVTAGKALCDDGLNIANPILKPIEKGLYEHISKNESNTKTEAGNFISDSAIGIATKTGKIYSGGIEANVSAVNMNLDTIFDTNSSSAIVYSERYETYYQNINRVSYVIQGNVDLRDYLTDDFKSDLYSVNSVNAATSLINKYGTHLFTGFQYGGMFQVTNYVRTANSSSDISKVTSLSSKMQFAFNNYGAGADFSFSEQFAINEQQSFGTSNYKFNMYGGESVTAVSLDQLFTYNSSMIDGNGNYVYDRWVTSINKGNNLAIIGTPSSARNIPIWELLPSNGYVEKREYLIEAYKNLCGDKYLEFLNKYPSTPRTIKEEQYTGIADIKGYSILHKGNTVYCEDNNTSGEYNIYADSDLYINYTDNIDIEKKEWKVTSGAENIIVIDDKNGIFNVKNSAIAGNTFTIGLYSADDLLYNKTFTIVGSKFSGGDGSEENPYLISNIDDFENLSRDSSYWGKHFKLTNNINFDNKEITGIGDKDNPFTGTFDGNYCELQNVKIVTPRSNSLGVFSYSNGVIKNLFVDTIIIGHGESKTDLSINYAGGLVGCNKGSIINCRVEDISLYVKYLFDDDTSMYVGGLVGHSSPSGMVASDVEKCSVDNIIEIIGIAENEKKKVDSRVYVGGLVGYAEKTKISNSYVRGINEIYGEAKGKNAYVYVSGCVAELSNNSDLSYSLVTDIIYVGGFAEKNSGFIGINGNDMVLKPSSLVSNLIESNVSNCYVESHNDISSGVSEGCYVQDNITYDSAQTISSEIWCADRQGNSAVLIEQTFDSSNALLVNVDNAKTEYYYGEPFNISGIVVQGRFANSSELIDVDAFSFDASAYDPYTIGTYPIKVSALGYTVTYNVKVRKVDVIRLLISQEKENIYVGEEIDEKDYEVKYVLENGETLGDGDGKLSYVNYPTSKISLIEGKYVLGDNLISAQCDDISGSIVVNASEKELKSIAVTKQPEKTTYKAGERFDISGLEVTATYADNSTKIIDNNELEIIGDIIVSGENKVVISYGAYVTCEVVVQGLESYTIVFKNWDGSLVSSNSYVAGEEILIPQNVTRPSDNVFDYSFVGWDKDVDEICGSSNEYVAQFEAKYREYNVVFKNTDGTIITSKTYHYGDLIEYPTLSSKEENGKIYEFQGWSTNKEKVDGNLEIIANYTIVDNNGNNNGNNVNDNTNKGLEWWAISLISISGALLLFTLLFVLKKKIKK